MPSRFEHVYFRDNQVREALSLLDITDLPRYSMYSLSIADIRNALDDAFQRGVEYGRQGGSNDF